MNHEADPSRSTAAARPSAIRSLIPFGSAVVAALAINAVPAVRAFGFNSSSSAMSERLCGLAAGGPTVAGLALGVLSLH